MAERRMFAKSIIDSDEFLNMPIAAQLLYFHLAMRADDDGFVNKPKTIMRSIGAKDDDARVLLERRYILAFSDGIVVIRHWRIHNYIRKDTYTETTYVNDKALLSFDEDAKTYEATGFDSTCAIPSTDRPRIDDTGKDNKVRLGKDSIDKYKHTAGKPDREGIKSITEAWNKAFPYMAISRMASSSKRYKMLTARIEEYGVDGVLEAIDNASNSKFLRAPNTSWFDFEWMMRPNNFPKVFEGKYTDRDDRGMLKKKEKDEWQS